MLKAVRAGVLLVLAGGVMAAMAVSKPSAEAQEAGGSDAGGGAADAKAAPVPVARHIFRQPALSPDGGTLVFVYDGDLWTVASAGGTARRLTSTVDNDSSPVFSPDGKWIAFASSKYGGADVYMMPAEGGPSRRITFHGASERPFGWTPDSKRILFESAQRGSGVDMWCVRVDGGEPWPISNGGFAQNEVQCAISPDGKTIAYVGNGGSRSHRQRGYNGSSSNDVWVCKFDGVTTSGHFPYANLDSNECFPVFLDNDLLAYVSFTSDDPQWDSRERKFNFASDTTSRLLVGYSQMSDEEPDWQKYYEEARNQVKDVVRDFRDLREPSKALRANKLAYTTGEREGWHLKVADLEFDTITTPDIRIESDGRTAEMVTNNLTSASEIAPSPDGKKVAFIAGSDVWVMAATEPGGKPRQVTNTVSREGGIVWTKDSLGLVYTSVRTGEFQLYHADLAAKTERALATVQGGATAPTLLPDGTGVIAVAGEQALVRVPLEGDSVTRIFEANFHGSARFGKPYEISPDGKWAVITLPNSVLHDQINLVELETGKVHRITRLYSSCRSFSFSADGKRIVFSNAGEEDSDIYCIPLAPEPVEFDEDKLDKAIAEAAEEPKPAAKPAPKPAGDTPPPATSITFEGINDRVARVTNARGSESSPIGLDDGKTIVFLGTAGETGTQVMALTFENGRAGTPRALTTSRTPKGGLTLSPNGKDLWFTDGGVMQRMKATGGPATAFPFAATQTRTLKDLREEAFRECVFIIGNYFYDAEMHGVDWKGISKRYMEAMASTPTGDEWGELMNELLGELNSSHQGFTAVDGRSDGFRESPAALGLEFDPLLLSEGKYHITKALKGGPCDPVVAGEMVGQYLTGINGVAFKPGETVLARLLEGTAGTRVKLNINGKPEFEGSREVSVRPIAQSGESNLYYDDWVAAQRKMVEHLSGGRIGYAHIRAMNRQAVVQFKRDLGDALEGKEAAVIDVRYNGGGNTAVNLLETLIKKPWVKRVERTGESTSGNEGSVGALEIPSALLINQNSFSNSEMIAQGYKTLGIGPVVGWPTGGAVIWTTQAGLIDGSSIRLPFAKVTTVDGENLENIGRQPDIKVRNPRDVLEAGHDPQTKAAVEKLLEQIGK